MEESTTVSLKRIKRKCPIKNIISKVPLLKNRKFNLYCTLWACPLWGKIWRLMWQSGYCRRRNIFSGSWFSSTGLSVTCRHFEKFNFKITENLVQNSTLDAVKMAKDVMRAFRDLCWFSSGFFFFNNKTSRQSIQNTAEDVKAGKNSVGVHFLVKNILVRLSRSQSRKKSSCIHKPAWHEDIYTRLISDDFQFNEFAKKIHDFQLSFE